MARRFDSQLLHQETLDILVDGHSRCCCQLHQLLLSLTLKGQLARLCVGRDRHRSRLVTTASRRHRGQYGDADSGRCGCRGQSPWPGANQLPVDLTARLVFLGEEEVHLTPLEYKLLIAMFKHAGKVLTHRHLLQEVWGPFDSQENHYLRLFVASLRMKLENDPARPRYILTEQGVGYRFASE